MAICKKRVCSDVLIFMFILILIHKIACYEKTLRKIVRNQSKMVQRPFSDSNNGMIWRNTSQLYSANKVNFEALVPPGFSQVKTLFHKMQLSKMATIKSSVEAGRSKSTYSKKNIVKNKTIPFNELRQTRNTFANISAALQQPTHNNFFPDIQEQITNNSVPGDVSVQTFYQVPTTSKFFPPVEEHNGLQNVEPKNKEFTIVIPDNNEWSNDNSLLVKGLFIANSNHKSKDASSQAHKTNSVNTDPESEKADFLIEEIPAGTNSLLYNYNISTNSYTCVIIHEREADINAQEKFSEFDIEPSWISKKHFWNHIFDSRYESLMRNPKWPPLKVILIPRTHVDSIWKRSFEQYHSFSVSKILSNIVKKLQFYSNLTFTWNEVSHLSHWWKSTTQKNRLAFRRLVKGGRLEITTGGWVETDEATTHLFGYIHQLTEGHLWLKQHLNYTPKTGWLTNSVSHSSSVPYFLSATGITNLVFTNLHYSWEQYLAEYQYSDFIWLQNWDNDKSKTVLNDALNKIGNDRFPKHSVLTHYLQFNSASFKACGPNKVICTTDFNFAKPNKNLDITTYNIKEKAEMLLEQYSKTGTITSHNVVMAPLGGPFRYESQPEFDYQYNNYQKLADFINVNREIYKATIEFGTPTDYFNTIVEKHKMYPTLKGDFLNFADINNGSPAYWTGFFTSRPLFKILLRRIQSTLRSTEILFSFALGFNAFLGVNASEIFGLLIKSRETVARLLDRNVVSGTMSVNALKYAHNQLLLTAKDCWYIQEVSASLLSMKPEQNKTSYLQKYVYREGEFISIFRTISPGDQIYLFNSLSHERTETVELMTRNPNVRIVDHNRRDVTIQINPVWKYNSDNLIKISRRFFKVTFLIIIPPLTLELFTIKETYDATQNAATLYCLACVIDNVASDESIFPFNIQPIQTGDIQLESYKHRLVFDEITGFMKSVVEKETNNEKVVIFDYGAFRSSDVNSGMFLFNTNTSKPLHDILMPYRMGTKSKIVMIVSGVLTTKMTSVFGRLLQHSVTIFNLQNSPLSNTIYIESKVDYEVSPKNRELELFMSIQTDIANGNPPEMHTDNNGFQYTTRILNISKRIESNMYPFTSMAYIQDHKSRLTFITDHAQGITALQEGQMVVMLDRRILFNDGRGTNEGLADSSATCHRYFILLENFNGPRNMQLKSQVNFKLPSLTALYLANSLNYLLDIFVINRNQSNLCHYTFFPLIKTSFPCDVAVVNYRIDLNRGSLNYYTPNTALMVLHRQSFSCNINHAVYLNCNGDNNFSLEKILRNAKAVYQTNLSGTNKGIPITAFNHINFPSMELMTLRIFF